MKLSINPLFIDKSPITNVRAFKEGWEDHDLTVEELASCVSQGWAFSAQFDGGIRKTEYFRGAEFLALDFDGNLSIAEALNHPLIRQYGALL